MKSVNPILGCGVLALGLLAAGQAFAVDLRAEDAVAAFADLCVAGTLGRGDLKSDPSAFDAQKMDDAFATELNQGRTGGAAWGVRAISSGAMLLVSMDPIGVCAVRVAEADEQPLRTAFDQAVNRIAAGEGATATPAGARTSQVKGSTVTFASWTIPTRRAGNVVIAITTAPVVLGMAQHMMTFSRAP